MKKEERTRIYILEGANIAFRALEESDLEGNWCNWFNDPGVTRFLGRGAFPNTRNNQRSFYQENVVNSQNQVIFAIEDKATQMHIGVASIRNIDWISRKGNIAIIIGEKAFRVGSNALEAYYLIVKHAFLNLNLHKVIAITMSENELSLKYCKRIGFETIGVDRESFYKNGTYKDSIYLELLRRDWVKNEGI